MSNWRQRELSKLPQRSGQMGTQGGQQERKMKLGWKFHPSENMDGGRGLGTNLANVFMLLMLLDKLLQNADSWWCGTNESVLQWSLAVLLQYCQPEVTHGSSLLSLQPSPALHYPSMITLRRNMLLLFCNSSRPHWDVAGETEGFFVQAKVLERWPVPCNFQENCSCPFMRSCLLVS